MLDLGASGSSTGAVALTISDTYFDGNTVRLRGYFLECQLSCDQWRRNSTPMCNLVTSHGIGQLR